MIPVTKDNINSFLHFGWLPRFDADPPIPLEWIPKDVETSTPEFETGKDLLKKAVAECAKDYKSVIVPLSGGLDSRAILMAAIETGLEITAVTVGVPGTFDFDIPKLVAKKIGFNHNAIDINNVNLETNSIVETATEIEDWTNVIEVNYNLLISRIYRDQPILTGLLGDFLAGSYAKNQFGTWQEALGAFVHKNQIVLNKKMTSPDFNPTTMFPATSQTTGLTYYEELVLLARHTCSFRPSAFKNQFSCLSPFKNKGFVKFMLSLPRAERIGQFYYQNMLSNAWPEAFSLPCKNNSGLPLKSSKIQMNMNRIRLSLKRRIGERLPKLYNMLYKQSHIDPYLNYIDFRRNMNESVLTRHFFHDNIEDLRTRDIVNWIDFDTITNSLETGRVTDAEAREILLLSTLEINIKSST